MYLNSYKVQAQLYNFEGQLEEDKIEVVKDESKKLLSDLNFNYTSMRFIPYLANS